MAVMLEEREKRKQAESNRPRQNRPNQNRRDGRPHASQETHKNKFLTDGTPVRNYCQRTGHIASECRKKQRQQGKKQQSGNQ